MANGQLIAARYPAAAGPDPFYRLNVIDNLDGTCTVYVEDRANPDAVSTVAAVPTTGLQIRSTGAGTPGGSNTQVQYNNAGALGGISGVTSDGTRIITAAGALRIVNIADATGANILFSHDDANFNLFLGSTAGPVVTSGQFNHGLGQGALQALTTGSGNLAVGAFAMQKLTTGGGSGGSNTAVGIFALLNGTALETNTAVGFNAAVGAGTASGSNNVAIGANSYTRYTTGNNNIAIGVTALGHVTTGANNVAIGTSAGDTALVTGNGNVFLGFKAGSTESGSNKLYIANDGTVAATLVLGDFSAHTFAVNGVITNSSQTATPAGGSTSARLLFGTTAGFGIYYGSSAPSVVAAKGSLYLRSDGTGANDRAYIATDSAGTWTPIVTVG